MGSFSAFAGGVALAVVMLPIVMRTAEEGLVLVPEDVRLAAFGLGATRFEVVSRVVLPAAALQLDQLFYRKDLYCDR